MSRDSNTLMTEIVLPSHTNAHGTIFGGVVMSWIDIAGAIAAGRHSRSPVVTVSIDSLHFIVPIKTGFIVSVKANVTYVGKTSMEVEVVVEAENFVTGETRKATHAFLTYVAVDEFGRPKKCPGLPALKTAEEKKRHAEAVERQKLRLKRL
ncbi:MAG: acyl-CoA thioesterase [Deltaproteobacteria bacterium]|nr:acyl-CoA thioesterase [Deltaproteobacteria bacterium]MBI3295102.1 acyl-CoA thioesterase [Deltaproteobacteria bacterium]